MSLDSIVTSPNGEPLKWKIKVNLSYLIFSPFETLMVSKTFLAMGTFFKFTFLGNNFQIL